MSKKVLFIFGTRPEAIKLIPLIQEFRKHPQNFETRICVTAQHRDLLDQVLNFFDVIPDYDLNIMQSGQTLFHSTTNILIHVQKVLEEYAPNLIVVQGDTTTAMVGALAAYYYKIPVAHIEAGLRSHDIYSPFPEEVNRRIIAVVAKWHFAPTTLAQENLLQENIKENIFVVGNTGIDALFLCLDIIEKKQLSYEKFFNKINFQKKLILLTAHRRENFGQPLKKICEAVKHIAFAYPDINIVYPVHPNPNVKKCVFELLDGIENVYLIEPLDYPQLVWLMNKSYIILTDSGGIQEEAPALQKPVLVLREKTERMESILSGNAKLVGSDKDIIIQEVERLMNEKHYYQQMTQNQYLYGDGKSSCKIVNIIHSFS
ncbi:MAG: UDP-N-acetylglucosamine 2-epimerase (non-hydrolyzing) [Raineya sp.]|nr:UDP-N-acetylglucosamine 2-epimerase (non-hydrolyzing) [Raineya sp.]